MGSVPHVRADVHLPLGGGSSYVEERASELTYSSFLKFLNKTKYGSYYKLPTLGDFFNSLAKYTNTHFFSKDTVESSEYLKPEVVKRDEGFLSKDGLNYYALIGQDEIGEYKLAAGRKEYD
ncbi:MAG: hypothetical protein PHO23_02835 [Candidatus Pacebacteria bacterium]|nr:hypothetical protein [Candidatus Paceibacterota bacterium]